MNITLDRRRFLVATGACLAFKKVSPAATPNDHQTYCVFTKPFTSLHFDELAERIAEIGFDGIEAPIRQGGHVEPDQVEDKLPELVAALKKCDLEITVMASDINDPRAPETATVLKTAAKLGIKRYRMKYFQYEKQKPIAAQLKDWGAQMRELAALNRELGIQAVYQNHAGDGYVGAALWDVQRLLEDIPVKQVGVAYDIRHATVEGGTSWPTTFRMIRPHVEMVYVKDFVWEGSRPKNVSLGKGRVSREFFSMLTDSAFNGPISLHEEYLDHRDSGLIPQHLAAIKRDLATLKQWKSVH